MTYTEGFTDVVVGRTHEGRNISLDFGLRLIERPTFTVEHDPISEALEFTASGQESGLTGSAGQMLELLLDIKRPAAPFAMPDILSIYWLWKRWHLNAMRAACAHMDRTAMVQEDDGYGGTRIACKENPCPAGEDYYYGKGWLYEPIPDVFLTEMRRLILLGQEATR